MIGQVAFSDSLQRPSRDPLGDGAVVCHSRSRRASVSLDAACPSLGLAVAHDGRIWNSGELRAELATAGEEFSTDTDTEVILRGFHALGDAFLGRLRGGFALAIWDGRGDGRLVLARDRAGERALYFRADAGGGLSFGSELRALLDGRTPGEIDRESVKHYLAHGCPPPDRSMLRGYRRLRAGDMLLWQNGSWCEKPCSAGSGERPSRSVRPGRHAAESLRERLEAAVGLRAAGDGSVGTLLWGTLESAAILACMGRKSPAPVRTYAASLGTTGLAAAERARRTAPWFGASHDAIIINARCGRLLPFIASQLDEPISDPLTVARYLVCRRAAQGVKVVLSARPSGALPEAHRMSRAASVETRMPFLDEAVGGVARDPRYEELPLKRAMRDLLPPTTTALRPRTLPFPLDDWLRCEWRTLVQDVLLDARAREREWVAEQELQRIMDEHLSGRANRGRYLYRLLALELWARSIVDKGGTGTPPDSVADCMRMVSPERPVRKVAVIAPAGIGDTIRLTPALVRQANVDPNVSVTLYVNAGRGIDEIMSGLAPVDRHVPIRFSSGGVAKLIELVRDLRSNRPERIVSTWVSKLAGLAGFLSGVRERSGWAPQWSWAARLSGLFWPERLPYDPPQKEVGTYDAQAFADMLKMRPLVTLAPAFAAPIWQDKALLAARERLGRLERPILAVSPVAAPRISQREYPLPQMRRVLEELLAARIVGSLALLGDSAGRKRTASLQHGIESSCVDLSGQLSLSATAEILRQCDAALVIDGGLLHVALATEIPVIALYGPTEIFSSDPRGGKGRYRAVSAFGKCRCKCLPHRGIRARGECAEGAKCLASIPPRSIVDAVAAQLGRKG